MNTKIRKILLICSGILLILIRLIGDIILLSIDKSLILNDNSLWNLTTSILIVGLAIYYYYEESKNDFNIKYDEILQFFNFSFAQATFLSITVIAIYIIVENFLTAEQHISDYFTLIIKTLLYLYLIVVAILNVGFSVKWVWSRRKKNTKEILLVLSIASLVLIVLNSLNYKDFSNQTFQSISVFIIVTFIMGISYYTPMKSNWIATLDKKTKIRLLFLSLINTIIGSIIVINTFNDTSLLFNDLRHYYSVASTFFSVSYIFFTVLNIRLFFNILNMLPSSTLFAKKHQEINNLTYLIRYVAESINKNSDYILTTIADLAIRTSGANGAWIEYYEEDYRIVNTFSIDSKKIYLLADKKLTIDIFKNFDKVHLVESISEDKVFAPISNYIPEIKSLIIIPIYSFDKRLGTILIYKNEEYALDYDDVQVMNAFGDNIRIALENSELMKESIEKEKYKSEMLIAQQMQTKLLPQTLPIINGYNCSAMSIPATVVGGDYYDVVELKNGKPCVIIGDVSGKGISASFYMAQLKGIVLSKSKNAETATELLSGINEIIYNNVESKMFITMSVIVFDDTFGNITIARAGHLPFIIKNNGNVELIRPNGIGVGLADNKIFGKYLEEKSLKLVDDAAVILITDGINELNTYNNTDYGYDPIINQLRDIKNNNAEGFIDRMKNNLQGFIKDELNHDDMTVFAVFKDRSYNN
ncbi:MAG TPA: SpoIIE family protein phosphatase [Candidatus Kapabacteria bacterium]|nr:SpoIIE family protein phosphatase [Candidatus Kapabacteria bacterium]